MAFLVLWRVAGVAIVGFDLCEASAKNGSVATTTGVPDDDDAAPR